MDKDIRDALVEICDVLKQKVRFDMARHREQELLDEGERLSKRLNEMIEKLRVGPHAVN